MKRRTRIRYTDSQKALMCDRWRKGESLHQIARLSDRHHSSVRGLLAGTGGIRPPARRRSLQALSLAEREDVSRALVAGHSIRLIAATLRRSLSTISRAIIVTVAPHGIAQAIRIRRIGTGRIAPRLVSWRCIPRWRHGWRASCNYSSRHSRSPAG